MSMSKRAVVNQGKRPKKKKHALFHAELLYNDCFYGNLVFGADVVIWSITS